MQRVQIKPEIMSPVGGEAQLSAAIEAGADAVYFGVNPSSTARSDGTGAGFHARAKVGFDIDAVPEIMQKLHSRGVLGFVAFNVLVFDSELRAAERQIIQLAQAGVDALIVQDFGIAKLAKEICPELAIHGSTQMSISSAEGAEFAGRFGASRVVLGRELSLSDIEKIAKTTNIELETFVHGALCVSYSGQCFSSEAWGGRSANRGQCAQACRLPYAMIVDGTERDLKDAHYLLSPGDLYALHQVPELVRIGINCLKIEGRYKDAEYVSLTTAAYRKAVDEAFANLPLSISKQEEEDLEQVYSRGLGAHFISGTNHQKVVVGRAGRHRGVLVGTVSSLSVSGVLVKLERDVKSGDGLVFDPANWRVPQGKEEGGFVYEVFQRGNLHELRFANNALDLSRIKAGDPVWRTHDPSLAGRIGNASYSRAVNGKFYAEVGELPSLSLSDELGNTAEVKGSGPVQPAKSRALSRDQVSEQIGKMGGTGYHLKQLDITLVGEGFLAISVLNALRRDATAVLTAKRSYIKHREARPALSTAAKAKTDMQSKEPALHLLVRTPEQLEAAILARPASITLDYLELYGLKPSVEKIKKAGIVARVASPRILKPSEQNIQKFLQNLDTGILVRSAGLLEGLYRDKAQADLIGDFSLNTANVLSANILLGFGLKRITPTHDLNARQVSDLATSIGTGKIEAIAYQHLPVFHTEHCVFCRFLSSGTDYTNCGHPCESSKVALRDERGIEHPVMADVGCRNTVFEGRAQVAAKHLEEWLQAGIADFRLEFVHETAEEVGKVTRYFGSFFSGEITASQLEDSLSGCVKQGIAEGSLFIPKNFVSLESLPML